MKDFAIGLIISVVIAVLAVSCSQQGMTKDMGGSLTRPMTDDDVAETHTFRESSEYGVFEGTVTIIEKKQNRNVPWYDLPGHFLY